MPKGVYRNASVRFVQPAEVREEILQAMRKDPKAVHDGAPMERKVTLHGRGHSETFFRAMRGLMKDGIVVRVSKGKYQLTEKGATDA